MARDKIEILRLAAHDMGWSEQERGRGGVVLISPEPHIAKIVLPERGPLRDSIMRSWVRKLVRYGDPIKRAVFFANYGDLYEGIDFSEYIAPLPAPPEEKKVKPERVKPEPKPKARPATIISENPWLAHKSPSATGGTRYESKAVVERHWSDGTIDYRCAWPGCEYVRDNPRSVANHYGGMQSHSPLGEDYQGDGVVRDTAYLEALNPRTVARIERWKQRLSQAAFGLDPTAEDFIERLAARMVELAGESTSDGGGEPMTAEQVLERVRRLVDDGSYLAAQERAVELDERVSKMEHDLAMAQEAIAEANARADRYRLRWNSFRDEVLDELVKAEEQQE